MRAQIVFDQRICSAGKCTSDSSSSTLRVRRRDAAVVATISFPIALAGTLREAQ
jgi:hypothetical protein